MSNTMAVTATKTCPRLRMTSLERICSVRSDDDDDDDDCDEEEK
jgi:hypothetical protein